MRDHAAGTGQAAGARHQAVGRGQAAGLLMSLADISVLAKVQRPVVSMWRRRSAGTADPFPRTADVVRGTERFAAADVVTWLQVTGRGNNPEAAADVAAFARAASLDFRRDPDLFNALGATLALKSIQGCALGELDADELLDLADEVDPDDEFLYTELEALAGGPEHGTESGPDRWEQAGRLERVGRLEQLARYADQLADAAYSPQAALEQLMGERFRTGLRGHADVALTPAATELVADIALALAAGAGHGGSSAAGRPDASVEPVFVDASAGASDLLLAIAEAHGDSESLDVLTPGPESGPDSGSESGPDSGSGVASRGGLEGAAARLALRRLRTHGIRPRRLATDAAGSFDLAGSVDAEQPVVHVAQYPAPSSPDMAAWQILSAVENTVLQMDDAQRGIVIAPASVLTDPAGSSGDEELRADILRAGRIRAIVRLPQGLLISRPRQAQALWVLGPAHADIGLADRWTMVADLSNTPVSPDVAADLVTDLVAAMGDQSMIRAHAFRFARFVHTRRLLARAGSLVATARATGKRPAGGTDVAVRVERLLEDLTGSHNKSNTGTAGSAALRIGVEPVDDGGTVADSAARRSEASVGALLANRQLAYLPGNRLEGADSGTVTDIGPGQLQVIGRAELLGEESYGRRRIGKLPFAANYPAGRLTEPGDIVFCTSPRPAAVVDPEGAAVVAYPARILRIKPTRPGETAADAPIPATLAADINALPPAARDWKRWQLRLVPAAQRRKLSTALNDIETQRAAARSRLNTLDELATLMMDGVAGRGLTLSRTDLDGSKTTDSTNDESTEGTR